MHAVDKIDVGDPGRPEHHPVPVGRAHAGVRGLVRGADVGLDLHDAPDARRLPCSDEPCPDEGAGGRQRVHGEARAIERARDPAGRRAAALRSAGHQWLKTTFAWAGMRNPNTAISAGMATVWMNCPMFDPSSDVNSVRRNANSSSSGGMFVYR